MGTLLAFQPIRPSADLVRARPAFGRLGHSVDDLLKGFDRPARSLDEFLETLLQALVDRLGLREATIDLAGGAPRTVARPVRIDRRAERRARERAVDDAVRAAEWLETADGGMRRPAARSRGPTEITQPIVYAGRTLGVLRLVWSQPPNGRKPPDAALQLIAQQTAHVAHRFQSADWAKTELGAPLVLVGMSPALREAEALLEHMAASHLPVLLEAEFGTEPVQFAAMIHAGGRRRDKRFVPVFCPDPEGLPPAWLKQAHGGTLFLEEVEGLRPDLQAQLSRQLASELASWPPVRPAQDVRVIASTSADLRGEVATGRFNRGLLSRLDVLSLRIPPLRERLEDMPALVAAALARRGFAGEAKRTAGLMAFLEGYAWPENLVELERVVARLAVMTGDQPIREADVLRFTPWLSPGARLSPRDPAPAFVAPESANGAGRGERWVRSLLARDVQDLSRLHEGLRRALLWLADHASELVTLDRLAREAHVSPSHLTFLFRTSLGLSFKTLLTRLRVERAKQMLSEAPARRVTDVAMTVGFSDLSHFERSFRRLVGSSPRDYRRTQETGEGTAGAG
jgi:DNA-binding NtrC family response regulator